MGITEADRRLAEALERHKRGEIQAAYEVYAQVLAEHPNHPTALHYLGLVAQQTGQPRVALDLLQKSIQLDPTDPRAHNHLGQVFLTQNAPEQAIACFERALSVDPRHVDSLNNLANLIRPRDSARALALYRQAREIDPASALTAYNLANALQDSQAFEEALALYERAVEIDPRHYQARHNLGVLLEQKGRFAQAIEQYQAVRAIHPSHAGALANLLAMRAFAPDARTVRDAEERLRVSLPDDDRVKLHQALGKYHDRAGRYAEAFAHFAAANGTIARRRRHAFDAARLRANFDRLRATFTADTFAAAAGHGSPSERPVFVVGMPRSGTTLTEQILASHPRVFGAGELQEIPAIAKSLVAGYPQGVAQLDGAALRALADRYLKKLDSFGAPGAARVVDKLPVNFTHLGLIARLFPNARIIHCRRDPLDVGLSCFTELFEMERDFTLDLTHFGEYFLEYERLMAHWRAVLPNAIHEQRYEELVADPETHTRALIAHCGLDWDDACLRFHETDRAVMTPSRWQVRQPIYSGSVGRWQRYAEQLQPLRRVLEQRGYRYA
jgi:tetratricopeptide (TPR) repeat protein